MSSSFNQKSQNKHNQLPDTVEVKEQCNPLPSFFNHSQLWEDSAEIVFSSLSKCLLTSVSRLLSVNRLYSHKLLTINNYVNCLSNFAFACSYFTCQFLRKSFCEYVSCLTPEFSPLNCQWVSGYYLLVSKIKFTSLSGIFPCRLHPLSATYKYQYANRHNVPGMDDGTTPL